jgi:hypothetical protein
MRGISITTITRCKKLLVLSALTVGLAAPATPAQAMNCATDTIGSAHSGGTVTSVSSDAACAPAYGQPAGSGTGRKVG